MNTLYHLLLSIYRR